MFSIYHTRSQSAPNEVIKRAISLFILSFQDSYTSCKILKLGHIHFSKTSTLHFANVFSVIMQTAFSQKSYPFFLHHGDVYVLNFYYRDFRSKCVLYDTVTRRINKLVKATRAIRIAELILAMKKTTANEWW